MGGSNAYAPNPVEWIDPLGLSKCSNSNNNVPQFTLTVPALLKMAISKDQRLKSGEPYPNRFKKKWSESGYDYEVRIHGPDPNAPSGSLSSKSNIYRVARRKHGVDCNNQGFGWEYGDLVGNWHSEKFLKTSKINPAANVAAKNTHIKVPIGVIK